MYLRSIRTNAVQQKTNNPLHLASQRNNPSSLRNWLVRTTSSPPSCHNKGVLILSTMCDCHTCLAFFVASTIVVAVCAFYYPHWCLNPRVRVCYKDATKVGKREDELRRCEDCEIVRANEVRRRCVPSVNCHMQIFGVLQTKVQQQEHQHP